MEISSHHSRVLQQLNEQRRQELFCDCSIVVEGRLFRAHRNVLFASSGYFKMLLSQSAREPGQPTTATFEVFSPDTFLVILDFVYTGTLSLTSQNVIEVMSAASYLQMTDIIGVCKTFIKSSLDINEKEKDRYFSLTDKGTSNTKPEERPPMYGAGWGAENSPTPPHMNPDMGVGVVAGNSWRSYGFHPGPLLGVQQPVKEHMEDPAKKHRMHLGMLSPGIQIPHYKPSKPVDSSRTGRSLEPPNHSSHLPPPPPPAVSEEQAQLSGEVDTTHMGYQHGQGTDVMSRNWPLVQTEHDPTMSVTKHKASKADEIYASMPTILGVMTNWREDELPRMRFRCPFCTHTVKRKADLKRHLRCHTGERPYPCEACEKRFTRLEHLRSHFQTIHQAGKPICRKCKRHVTELTGRVVQEGTRRYRLCNECLAESGMENISVDLDSDCASFQHGKESVWSFEDDHSPDAELIDDTSDLVIQQVDDSDDDTVEEKEVKPNIQ
ncbi:zinc finger and BTB domain-containing protein 8A [Protopterus annectens]|uniref:zinc finger and BTB domain-containing protein 8A n=1 Tax=Protopterus annectens TaxID=7888 RepID=UPI001CFBF872|nr:zinc finger and BTB domain-containing protein 8A [Protopterus annectens]